tara:strand:+ start:3234 stop:4763 length:1530 start_codon:yes stop_codon:yes gene_type:complete
MAVFAGVAAAAGIASGISGALGARSANRRASRNERNQRRHNRREARRTNRYNRRRDRNERENYFAMRTHNRETQLQNHNYQNTIADYRFDATMSQYNRSQEILNQSLQLNRSSNINAERRQEISAGDAFIQRTFARQDARLELRDELGRQRLAGARANETINASVAQTGIDTEQQRRVLANATVENRLNTTENFNNLRQTYDEQAVNRREQYSALEGIRSRKRTGTAAITNTIEQLNTKTDLARESAMVESLLSESRASLGQAGRSTVKARQSNRAALQRSLMALESEASGKGREAAIQLAELNAETSVAETGAELNLQRIENTLSDANRDSSVNLQDIQRQTNFTQSTADIDLLRIQETSRRAVQEGRFQRRGINDSINNSNRDYINNLAVINANYRSSRANAAMNLRDIGLQRQVADHNTIAAAMIRPERVPYAPEPQEPPEHIFLRSQRARPGFVAQGARQNVLTPLLSGIATAGSALTGVNVGSMFGGGGGSSLNMTPNINYRIN